jgi:TolB-like protein/Flp pilus assembly protein TadD
VTGFLNELKRRNVIRMAGLYLVGAWLLVQVAGTLLPVFDAPAWMMKTLVALLAACFIPALVFSWVFELTPKGLKRDEDVKPEESIAPQTARRMNRLIIAVLVLALAYFAFDKFVLAPRRQAAVVAAVQQQDGTPVVVKPGDVPSDRSIAVLPFENLSEDKANEYFASGMHDMVLTKLAAIGDLKVISRTSTERYASRPDDLKTIARQLGVATILEGSVQKSGNSVLINVQLIDAASDNHLWAEAYPRTLDNIFGVEGEVAQKVADALKAKLTPTESASVASVPTHNPEAYDLYLRANANLRRGAEASALVPKVIPLAIELYQQAFAKDPGFALAAAEQAQAHMTMYWFAPDHTAERLASAKAAAEQALSLQPELGAAHFALGLYWYFGHRDYAQALQQLELARKVAPNDAQIAQYFAAIDRRQGRWDDAIATYQRATTLDPRSGLLFDQLAATYACVRRYADANRAYAQATAVARDPIEERINQAFNNVLWKADLGPLRSALGSLTPGSDDYAGNAALVYLLAWWSRDYAAAIATADNDSAENWNYSPNVTLPRLSYLAMAYDAAGNAAKARPLYAAVRTQMQAALAERGDDPDLHLALGLAAAGLGLRDEAISEGRKATGLMPVSRDHFSGPGYLAWLAQLYARVGDNDQAFDTLRQVLALPFSGMGISPSLLKLDPVWDPLRKDPRFQKLITDGEAAQDQVKP